MARDLAKLLNKLLEDEAFERKVRSDPAAAAADIGWDPEEHVTFAAPEKDYWGCGTKCGCSADTGRGCDAKRGNRSYCPESGKPGKIL